MDFEIGSILEGKVTGITSFGAFIALPDNKSGLVHISEIANTYVSNVRDFLTEGQTVKVKLIDIDKNGRINLSIKKTIEAPPKPAASNHPPVQRRAPKASYAPTQPQQSQQKTTEQSFEDRLKQFMQDSDNKISGLKMYKKTTSTRRGRK